MLDAAVSFWRLLFNGKKFRRSPRKGAPRMRQSGGGLRRISMGTDEFKVQVG